MTAMPDPQTTSRAPRRLWICGQLLRSSPHTHRLNNNRRIQDLRPRPRGPADRQFQLSPPTEIVDADHPRAIVEKFATIRMVDIHVPTADRRHLVLARHTQPSQDHELLLRQLDLTLPKQPPPQLLS